jgi:aspartyl protease
MRGGSRNACGVSYVAALCFAEVCLAGALPEQPVAPASDKDSLSEIVVEAPEPRFVAATRRDRIGRIWAPVLINDKGPFRLVLDTGASHSAVDASVAEALGIALPTTRSVVLNGATGSRTVSAIPVESVVVGDVDLRDKLLPIVTDALGGAEGILGTEGLLDKRIYIDFRHDRITIKRSHNERTPPGFVTIKVNIIDGLLVVADATVGRVPARLIIDTGGQSTIANEALRQALRRGLRPEDVNASTITGTTLDVQHGDRMLIPEMVLGGLRISPAEITVGDFYIFQHWHMTKAPTIMIGMDVLGLFDTLIIDYKRHDLQIQTRSPGNVARPR